MSQELDCASGLSRDAGTIAPSLRVLVLTAESELYRQVRTSLLPPDFEVLPLLDQIGSDEIFNANAGLLIVDQSLPAINVLLLIRELRLLNLSIPIVYISASAYSSALCQQLQPIFLVDKIVSRSENYHSLPMIARRLCADNDSSTSSPYLKCFGGISSSGALTGRRQRSQPGQAQDLETMALISRLACEYIREIPETLNQIQIALMTLSRDKTIAGDASAVQVCLSEILNAVHQINGTGSSFGFIELGVVANLLERKLDLVTTGQSGPDDQALAEYLGYVELLQQISAALIAALPPDTVAQSDTSSAPDSLDQDSLPSQQLEKLKVSESSTEVLTSAPVAVRRIALVAASDSPGGQAIRSIIFDQFEQPALYQLIDANNALSAFNLIEEYRPELLIIEARLPGLNGLEACKMIRSHPQWREAKVLMLIDSQDKSESVIQSGADDYLVTPAQVDATVSKLKELLAKKIDRTCPAPAASTWTVD